MSLCGYLYILIFHLGSLLTWEADRFGTVAIALLFILVECKAGVQMENHITYV